MKETVGIISQSVLKKKKKERNEKREEIESNDRYNNILKSRSSRKYDERSYLKCNNKNNKNNNNEKEMKNST